jgi:hypothetical protein
MAGNAQGIDVSNGVISVKRMDAGEVVVGYEVS